MIDSLYIVISVHNRIRYTRNCLQSLRRQTVRGARVVVIDDGSTDGTGEMIKTEFPEVILLHGDGTLWWTGATNLGVEYALAHDATCVMTLNDDTIATDTFVAEMLRWAAQEPSALLGALAIDARDEIPVYGGERLNWKTVSCASLLTLLGPEQHHGLHEVTHFPGRGLLIPAALFREIGLFDSKHFPHYAADYDFTHRAIRAGRRVFCNFDAWLLIYPSASGRVDLRRKKSLSHYYAHLFGNKGGGNLRVFTYYVWFNCPPRYRAWFMLRGYLQRVFGYWLHETSAR